MFVVCLVSDLRLPLLFLFRSFSRQLTLNVVTQEDHNICSGFPFFFFFLLEDELLCGCFWFFLVGICVHL